MYGSRVGVGVFEGVGVAVGNGVGVRDSTRPIVEVGVEDGEGNVTTGAGVSGDTHAANNKTIKTNKKTMNFDKLFMTFKLKSIRYIPRK